jgi:hypothetical protein
MPRIRSIKPEFFSSEQIVSVSIPARYLFEGIWVFGDDDGYIAASPIQLKMKVFPGDAIDVTPLLDELLAAGLVERVPTDQGPALWVPSFRNHQSPKYPTPTKFTRDGTSLTERSPKTPGDLPQASPRAHPGERERRERSGGEGRGEKPSSEAIAIRPEIIHLLDLLDSEIVGNGGKAPKRTKKNIDAVRLMLDRDQYTVDQIERAIHWCQSDEFWRSNILSMSKLREKYEQLRLAAQRPPYRGVAPQQSKAARNAAEYQRIFGGEHEHAGSIPALDAGVRS